MWVQVPPLDCADQATGPLGADEPIDGRHLAPAKPLRCRVTGRLRCSSSFLDSLLYLAEGSGQRFNPGVMDLGAFTRI